MARAPGVSCRRSGSTDAAFHKSRATPRSAVPATGFARRYSCVTIAGGHRNSHDKAGRDRPAFNIYANLQRSGWGRAYVFLAPLAKAASTSSFLMRAAGLPGWPRFCSSVPSPIMPGCGLAEFGLVPLESGLLVMLQSPGADARDSTARAPSCSDALSIADSE